MRFLKISLAILFTGLFISLFASSHVNAQSAYDNSYQTTDNIILNITGDGQGANFGNEQYDVTNETAQIVLGLVPTVFPDGINLTYIDNRSGVNTLNEADLAFMRDSFNSRTSWTISQGPINNGSTTLLINWTDNNNPLPLTFGQNRVETDQYLNGYTLEIRLGTRDYLRNQIVVRVYEPEQRRRISGISTPNAYIISQYNRSHTNLVSYNTTFTYPDDYNGELIQDEVPSPVEPDENLYPQYEYKVQKSDVGMAYHGELTIKYLKNLPYFLSGISTVNVSQMTNNWGEIDTVVDSRMINPAGHLGQLDELGVRYSLDELNPGYYMIQITHNQQLDSPPWPENASEKYYVYPVYMQFHWDGQNTVINDNIGCTDLCNPQRDEKNKYERYFDTIGLPVGGLQEVILAPLAFIEQLPRGHENCEPVFLPLPNNIGMIMLPCMTPIYQQHYNSVFVIYQTILTGLFAYYVSIRMFGNVKELANPKDDGIEAVRL